MNSRSWKFAHKSIALTAIVGLLSLGAPFVAFAVTPPPPPTVTLSSTALSSTAQNPIPVTATFSEGVTGFDATDIHVDNGSIVNFVTSSSSVYTFGISWGAPSGTVSVNINSDVATDASAQPNDASNQLQFIIDPTASDATSTSASPAFITFENATSSAPLFSGPPGTMVNAIGGNFAASELVEVGFGGATSTETADASGNFTEAITIPNLPVGPAQITAVGESSGFVETNSFFVEPASNTGSTSTATSSNTTSTGPDAPVITMTPESPTNGSSVGTTSVTFGFTVNDPTATITCDFGPLFACGSPVTVIANPDGPFTFSVTAASSTGISTTTVNFTVDTVAPTVTEDTPVPNPNNGVAPTYSFNSTEAGTVTLGNGCSITNGTVSAGTSTVTLATLASGTYNCTLTLTDAAGNVSNTLNLPFTVNAPVAPSPSGGGGGGGGGGGIISGPLSIGFVNTNPTPSSGAGPAVPLTPPVGQVLGASTYNFTQSLSIGSTGSDVTQLQMVLIAGGFLHIVSPTGYYGPLTALAVSAYQAAHGLPQVGVVGPQTRAALNQGTTASSGQVLGASTYNFAANLTIGSTGADVTALQQALTKAGVYSGPVTGYFGPLTEAAVKTYQTSKGISATGFVGPLTRAALNAGV